MVAPVERPRICIIEGCNEPPRTQGPRSRGLCARHYHQMRYRGQLEEFPVLPPASPAVAPRPQSVPGEQVVLVLSREEALLLARAASPQLEVLERAARTAGVMAPLHRARARSLATMVATMVVTARGRADG